MRRYYYISPRLSIKSITLDNRADLRYNNRKKVGGAAMTVELKLNVRSFVGDMRDGAYEVPEGATAANLLSAAERENGITLSDEVKDNFSYIVNRKPARAETVLRAGDVVRVLYKVFGG
jgi:sulfur carrier protein ThiS